MSIRFVPPESSEHRAFSMLFQQARQVHRGSGRRPDYWSRRLKVDDGIEFGAFERRTGDVRIGPNVVAGIRDPSSPNRANALATVLHESLHTMREISTGHQPGAVRDADTLAMDEGLVEFLTQRRLAEFAQRVGLNSGVPPVPAYAGPTEAVTSVLTFAAGSRGAVDLVDRAMNRSVDLDFRSLASAIAHTHLRDTLDGDGQTAAAVKAIQGTILMAGWAKTLRSQQHARDVARTLPRALEDVTQQIRRHHEHTDQPFRLRGEKVRSAPAVRALASQATQDRVEAPTIVDRFTQSGPMSAEIGGAISSTRSPVTAVPHQSGEPLRPAFEGLAHPRGAVTSSPSAAENGRAQQRHDRHGNHRDDGLAK